jgi:uncharacterized coiled-coil protein SlyX
MLTSVRGAGRATLLVSLAFLGACQGKGAAPRISADSTAFYRDQVASLTTVSAQKDSLMIELSETTKLITDVSAELATIKTTKPTTPVVAGEGVKTDARAEMLAQVRQLTSRVRESEQRLAVSRQRVERLAGTNDSLRTALAAYANTITELQGVVESQKETIRTLNEQIASLTGQVTTLSQQKAVLTDTVGALSTRENEVFYIVGTKQDLVSRGVVTQEGGTRVLVVTRVGETLVPARVLDPAQFTRADRRTLSEIAMPKADQEYRIVSRHDLAYAEAPTMNKGKFKGALRITSPQQFWSASKYLIIVEN